MFRVITASAPGKLMLMGEHGVLFGHPCLVTAVGQRMRATVTRIDEPVFRLEAKDVGVAGYEKAIASLGEGEMPKGARFAEMALRNFLAKHPQASGVAIETSSDFSPLFGFGSSSASVVSIIKGLCEAYGIEHAAHDVFDLGFKTVLDVQGAGSGFDVAVAVWGGTLYYVKDQPETLQQRRAQEKIIKKGAGCLPAADDLHLVIGYSGIKADTVSMMKAVDARGKSRGGWDDVYQKIGRLVDEALPHAESHDWQAFGDLMNQNQALLSMLGVSTPMLDAMIAAARGAGAFGAKLSGAGGGDCMIALVSPQNTVAVAQAIEAAGGQVIEAQTGVEGMTIE